MEVTEENLRTYLEGRIKRNRAVMRNLFEISNESGHLGRLLRSELDVYLTIAKDFELAVDSIG